LAYKRYMAGCPFIWRMPKFPSKYLSHAAWIFLGYSLLCLLLPQNWWPAELLRLGLSVVIPAMLLLALYSVFANRNTALLFIPALLVAGSSLSKWVAVSKQQTASDEAHTLKVGTFNMATLDRKRFTANAQKPEEVDYSPMFRWVEKNNDLDILCLQEFYDSFKPGMNRILDSIVQLGDYRYYCINPSFVESHKGFFGVIIFSKTVPADCKKFIYGQDELMNKGIVLDFNTSTGDTLRIMNIHLASMSIRFEMKPDVSVWALPFYWLQNTYQRLQYGFEQRESEVTNILNYVQRSPQQTIVCGDFNATPHMHANMQMRQHFTDAFLKAGNGWGFTYHHFPNIIRIDYQYYRGDMQAVNSYTDRTATFSDHYPLITTYKLPYLLTDVQPADTTQVVVEME
jgi:endonuclease/exonuclease/phosphatase family metal-dependent hydrolase